MTAPARSDTGVPPDGSPGGPTAASAPPEITGLNHLTLATADLARAFAFYVDVLGCRPRARWTRGAYLEAGGLWLCLSLDAATAPAGDYTHVALTVADGALDAWARRLDAAGARRWKTNTSEGGSIYFLDPDGHRLELHAGDLGSRLASLDESPYEGLERFP